MFDDPKKELRRLQEQLLAEEEEDYEEYEEEYDDADDYDDDLDLDAIDELLEEDAEEEEEEPIYRNFANRYGRGSPKEFDYLEDEEEFDDDTCLYREGYRKGRRKKKKGNLGWVVIAFLEVIAIAAIALWWLSWMM